MIFGNVVLEIEGVEQPRLTTCLLTHHLATSATKYAVSIF
jgi:hypothetical protein